MDTSKIANINVVRHITNTLGGGFNKSLGQHFLINQKSLLKFLKYCNISDQKVVLEIGSGIGVITYCLCSLSKHVVAIEIDNTKIPALTKVLENYSNYSVIQSDARSIYYNQIYQDTVNEQLDYSQKIRIVGALPYNSSKVILRNLLTSTFNQWDYGIFIIQKEVANKYISNKKGKKTFLNIFLSLYADIELLFNIPPKHFMPIPKVDSSVIKITPHQKYEHINRKKIIKFIKIGYSAPRKKVTNNLKSFGINKDVLIKVDIDYNARAENLTLDDWIKLYNLFSSQETITTKPDNTNTINDKNKII